MGDLCNSDDGFRGVLHNDLMKRHNEVCAERDRYREALRLIASTPCLMSDVAKAALSNFRAEVTRS